MRRVEKIGRARRVWRALRCPSRLVVGSCFDVVRRARADELDRTEDGRAREPNHVGDQEDARDELKVAGRGDDRKEAIAGRAGPPDAHELVNRRAEQLEQHADHDGTRERARRAERDREADDEDRQQCAEDPPAQEYGDTDEHRHDDSSNHTRHPVIEDVVDRLLPPGTLTEPQMARHNLWSFRTPLPIRSVRIKTYICIYVKIAKTRSAGRMLMVCGTGFMRLEPHCWKAEPHSSCL